MYCHPLAFTGIEQHATDRLILRSEGLPNTSERSFGNFTIFAGKPFSGLGRCKSNKTDGSFC